GAGPRALGWRARPGGLLGGPPVVLRPQRGAGDRRRVLRALEGLDRKPRRELRLPRIRPAGTGVDRGLAPASGAGLDRDRRHRRGAGPRSLPALRGADLAELALALRLARELVSAAGVHRLPGPGGLRHHARTLCGRSLRSPVAARRGTARGPAPWSGRRVDA